MNARAGKQTKEKAAREEAANTKIINPILPKKRRHDNAD